MRKSRVFSLVIAFTLIATLFAPIAALASVSASVSGPSTAAPGETITITVRVSSSVPSTSVSGEVNLGGMSYVESSTSGFGLTSSSSSSAFYAMNSDAAATTTGGTVTYKVTIPSNATDGQQFTFSVPYIEASDANGSGGSHTVTVSGSGGGGNPPVVNPTTIPGQPTTVPGQPTAVPPVTNPPVTTPKPDGSGHSFSISAKAEEMKIKAGSTVRIRVYVTINQGSYRSFGALMGVSGVTPDGGVAPSIGGFSPLSVGATMYGFTATDFSGQVTSNGGTIEYPVKIPSDAKEGSSYYFTVSQIEAVTSNDVVQTKNDISIKLTVGSGTGSGGGSGTGGGTGSGSKKTPEPVVTPMPVKAPTVRPVLTGAMSGMSAGDTVAYQLKLQVADGEATGFNARFTYDSALMAIDKVSTNAPATWSSSFDQMTGTISTMKTSSGASMVAGDEMIVNVQFKLATSLSSAALLSVTNAFVTDIQWNQHQLADVSAIANTNDPSYVGSLIAAEEAEPGALVEVVASFSPYGGAFKGFAATLEYDQTKLSLNGVTAPSGWQVQRDGDTFAVMSTDNIVYPSEALEIALTFMVSGSAVARGDMIPITLSNQFAQAIGDKQVTAPAATGNLNVSANPPSFTVNIRAAERRVLPGVPAKFLLTITSTSGHLAGFSMNYSLTEGLAIASAVNDLGWTMTYEGGRFKLYTNPTNAIKKGQTLTVEVNATVSGGIPYGSTLTFETGEATGVSHLGEQVAGAAAKGSVLVQSAFVNQKTGKYDFTSSIKVGVNDAYELKVGDTNYGAVVFDKNGATMPYTAYASDIGNREDILTFDAAAGAEGYEYRKLVLELGKTNSLRKAGIDYIALVVDGGIVMVNLNLFVSEDTADRYKDAGGKLDSARLVLEIEPVNEKNATISQTQLLAQKSLISEPYHMTAAIDDGTVFYELNQLTGCSFVMFLMADPYLKAEVADSAKLAMLGVDASLLAEVREARLLSDIIKNSNVNRVSVGIYSGDGIYAVTQK